MVIEYLKCVWCDRGTEFFVLINLKLSLHLCQVATILDIAGLLRTGGIF